jgi:hypothetical protein
MFLSLGLGKLVHAFCFLVIVDVACVIRGFRSFTALWDVGHFFCVASFFKHPSIFKGSDHPRTREESNHRRVELPVMVVSIMGGSPRQSEDGGVGSMGMNSESRLTRVS